MSGERAKLDGREVDVRPGETILEAARRLGVEIPTLCHAVDLVPEGGCRVCLVEVAGGRRPLAACHAPLRPGMEIRTDGERLRGLRRDVLSLILATHPPDRFAADPAGNEVERLMAALDLRVPRFGWRGAPRTVDRSHPYLAFDPTLCITCRRCLHACERVQGQFVYGIEGRGPAAKLVFGPGGLFAESDCSACGACVDRCPTAAITDRDRLDATPAEATTVSTCGYCGVGCQVAVETAAGRVLRIGGVADAAVNRGHLCAKGRYAHAWHRHPDRLTRPLRRHGDGWEAVSWDEAITWLAGRLRDLRDRHGGAALGAVTSSRSTNEANYLLQKLFRATLGSNNVDCCARVCHASTALALQLVTGTGAASASYVDIERARCIVVAGANPTEAHPVVGARIKQAALRGTPLVVIDPRRIELADYATLHLALRPGTNVALFNALAKRLVESGRHDRDYVEARTEGFEALAAALAGATIEEAAAITGVEAADIERAADLLAGPTLFVHGLGLSELTQGTGSVIALCNLGMLTGSVGRPGAGMLPLRGQNNVQGAADMGAMPDRATGYQRLDDPEVRARLRRVWGRPPPADPGLTLPEMVDAAARGELRGLWVQGEDIAQSEPDQSRVLAALERLDLLVVQDLFLCETARYAHLVLPAAGALEQEGTFTNGERRIQRVRPAVPPPGEARPDWRVVADVARALEEPWDDAGPAAVMDEIAAAAPRLFGGVSYDRLGPDGLQWPCPAPDHPGTATVHADGFLRGKGALTVVDPQAPPERPSDDYPLVLITGRVLQQYNVGTMTRRTAHRDLTPADTLEIHPADADRLGIRDGEPVEIASRWGATRAPARRSRRVQPGHVFLSFHYPETHANVLVGPHLDPQSKCPDYKVTAVRVRRAEAVNG